MNAELCVYVVEPPDREPEAHVMTEAMCDIHEWTTWCWCSPIVDGIIPGIWGHVVVHQEGAIQ